MHDKWSEYYFDETKWEVRSRYTDLTPLGKGAYGLVCSGNDSSKPEDQRAGMIKTDFHLFLVLAFLTDPQPKSNLVFGCKCLVIN
jgi:hypothetical protein